jgi:hypothetical protein
LKEEQSHLTLLTDQTALEVLQETHAERKGWGFGLRPQEWKKIPILSGSFGDKDYLPKETHCFLCSILAHHIPDSKQSNRVRGQKVT